MTIRTVSIFGLAAMVFLSACATKPPAAPEPEPEPQVVVAPEPEPEPTPKEPEINKEELEALHGRVLALRKEAFELGLKDIMADEYATAEARYVTGKTALDADDRPTAKTELEAAEPLFAGLLASGTEKVATQRQSDATAARDRAMAANADSLSPATLAAADVNLTAANAAFEAGTYKEAIAAYTRAVAAFDAAEKRSAASTVRSRVDELAYGPMDAGNYELAGQKLDAVDGLVGTDPDAAQDSAAEALLRYNLVLAKGWELSAGTKRELASKHKSEAEGIKAQVAVKKDYAEAKAVWDEAETAFKMGDHEASFALYEQAEAMFATVYETAARKRAIAEAELLKASTKTQESATIVQQADDQLGVPEAPVEESTEPETTAETSPVEGKE